MEEYKINNKEIYGYIYVTLVMDPISKLFNHYYIGQKKCKKSGIVVNNYYGSGTIIKNYIKIHGTKYLIRYIITWASSHEELNQLEAFYVDKKTLTDPLCLNSSTGGNCKVTWSKASKQKASNSQKRRFENKEERDKNITKI